VKTDLIADYEYHAAEGLLCHLLDHVDTDEQVKSVLVPYRFCVQLDELSEDFGASKPSEFPIKYGLGNTIDLKVSCSPQ